MKYYLRLRKETIEISEATAKELMAKAWESCKVEVVNDGTKKESDLILNLDI